MRATEAQSGRCDTCMCFGQPVCPFLSYVGLPGVLCVDVRVKVVHLVIHPSCSDYILIELQLYTLVGRVGSPRTGQLIGHVLVELVAKLVGADQGAGLGVTYSLVTSVSTRRVPCRLRFHTDVLLNRPECQLSLGSYTHGS